ncbi:hypothetical protein CMV_018175, partial [Castanea mollissima]
RIYFFTGSLSLNPTEQREAIPLQSELSQQENNFTVLIRSIRVGINLYRGAVRCTFLRATS